MDNREITYNTSLWWLLTVHGIAGILFGIACVFWPGLTLITFLYLFGAYILVSGIIAMLQGLLSIGRSSTWILTLLLGVLELGIGIYLLRHPRISFELLILLTGSSLVLYAVFEIIAALSDQGRSATSKMLTIIAGVVAGLAGIFMFFQPVTSGVAFVWIVGLFALINGPIWIALSLDVKHTNEQLMAGKK